MNEPEVVSDSQVIRHILSEERRFVCYLGAGASAEAGVPTGSQICDKIRDRTLETYGQDTTPDAATLARIDQRLQWDDPGSRYPACVRSLGGSAARVQFFRQQLRHRRPAFAHHAVALLTGHEVLHRTCITTNFDKLLENAYAMQGRLECQALRTDDELRYLHDDATKAYLIKLHGDYDTNNIMNTEDETVRISQPFRAEVARVLAGSGLVVLGTAGWEQSVHKLFDELEGLAKDGGNLLELGLFWGVHMRVKRPDSAQMVDPLADDVVDLVHAKAKDSVNPQIRQMLRRLAKKGIPAALFPIWGTGGFLHDVIRRHGERGLVGRARVYLDHRMRLRDRFEKADVSEDGIRKILAKLSALKDKSTKRRRGGDLYHDEAVRAVRRDRTVRLVYGDIARRSELGKPEFEEQCRAVVSAEDTWLSAGGGVAYRLLQKAGERYMLNELAKCYPIDHCDVAVTSGGDLPVNFVFHAAAIAIDEHGDYIVDGDAIRRTMQRTLEIAETLRVQMLWLPLVGAGAGSIEPQDSLRAILEAIVAYPGTLPSTLTVVVFSTRTLSRHDGMVLTEDVLGADWTVTDAS